MSSASSSSSLPPSASPVPDKPRRAACAACLRAASACICRWIVRVRPRTALLILQHPLEVGNAKNSARLLHLSVEGSVLAVGEAFEADTLDALLHADGRQPVLLYPEAPGSVLTAPPLPAPQDARLVLLDATWRKSRKMLHQNPVLADLPRLALRELPSRYRIRKAHAPDQLSTLEAAAHALAELEGDSASLTPLFDAFDGFVQQQAAFIPRA